MVFAAMVVILVAIVGMGSASAAITSEDLTQLTTDSANEGSASWSPDGNDIIFTRMSSPKKIIKLTLDDLSETQLTSYTCSLHWGCYSPDGTQIAYNKDNCNGWYDVFVVNSDGSSDHCITCGYSGMNDQVSWYPISNKIIYENAWDCCNRYPWDIISIKPDSSGKTTLVSGVLTVGYHAMSPDESKILYSTETYRDSHIWMMKIKDLNTGTVTDLDCGRFSIQTQSWQSQIFSPDGSKIVYHSDETGNRDIYTINDDGTGKTQLTTDTSDDLYAYFSPDGSKIVFVSDRTGNNDIWVMDEDGSNKAQLTTSTSDDIAPSWSPDGNKIVFQSDRSGNCDIWLMELLSVNQPPVANAGGPYEGGEGSPIIFDASSSSDSDGDPLTYRWDFDNDETWDTEWSDSSTASYTWGDDWSGMAKLEVSDGELTDTDTASVTVNNVAPTVDVSSDQTVDEGDIVSFYGSFTDPGGLHDTHTIEWDYGDGETSTGTLRPTHAYGDNGVYSVILTVTDEDGGVGSNTLSVTVHNVAPTASIDDAIYVEPGHNLHFGLPYQELRLRGSFIDAGWLDTHRATWVHENSDETRTAILTEENEQPDSTGTIEMGYYFLFEQPTYFTITLKVTDDDGDIGTDQFTGRIRSAEEAIPIVNDYIQDLPDDAFEKNPDQQKKVFSEKLNEAIELIDAGVYQEAIDKLQHDIRAKADGHVDGKLANDWIIDPEAQQEICKMIDDLIAYLETLL